MTEPITLHHSEMAALADLRPHPRNYHVHPEQELEHLAESLREHGVYRNVVVARDNTILAGHGVVAAARRVGLDSLPVVRLDLAPNDPRALKVVIRDNEIGRLAEVDDVGLAHLLESLEIAGTPTNNLGLEPADVTRLLAAISDDTLVIVPPTDDRTPREMLATYESGLVRQIVLILGTTEYAEVAELLDWLRDHLAVATNTEAMVHILRQYHATHRS